MSGNPRKRRSMWDNKEENQITSRTSEQISWQERENYPRYDRKSSDNEADYALKSKDFNEGPNREPSPSGRQRDSKRELYDMSHRRRSGDVAKRYTLSPPEHGPGQQNHIHPEGTRDLLRRRSRSRSRGRGSRGRSRSPSRGRNNRSRSLSRGREREVVYGRSRTPPNDYDRRDLRTFSERRRGFIDPPPQVCRNFTAGDCRRGGQCKFLHPTNGARSERDKLERQGTRGEREGPHYDLDREELMRNFKTNVCNNFLMGRCRMGFSCRYSHHDAGGGDNNNDRERQLPPVAPCKFFLIGNCSRSNCRFSHDNAPTHNNREFEQRNDRRDRDYGDTTERRDYDLDVKDRGGNRPTWHDERNKDDMHNQSKKWTPPRDGDGMGMDFGESEAPTEINKTDPECRTPYEFSASLDSLGFQQPTSILAHSVIPETSQLYNNAEGNISTALGFGSANSANAIEDIPMPGQNFNQNSDSFGLPLQQFGGNNQDRDQPIGSLKPSDGNNMNFSGQVQPDISPFKAKNSIDSQYGPPGINHSFSQRIDDQSVHISNLPASLTEKFVNVQLPQLYAVLNPPIPEEPMPSVPNLINNQTDQISIYQKRDHGDIEQGIPDNSNQYPGSFSHSIAQNGASMNSAHMNSQPSQSKTSPKSAPEEPNKPITEKTNQALENNGPRIVESDVKIGDGPNWKDEKAMRLFKNSLVEFVKDILKPKWKEGQMSRDIHKSIVKKVVDKVTSATQGINIPSTQAKLDQYLQTSKPKLAKLVEAYIERSAKAS